MLGLKYNGTRSCSAQMEFEKSASRVTVILRFSRWYCAPGFDTSRWTIPLRDTSLWERIPFIANHLQHYPPRSNQGVASTSFILTASQMHVVVNAFAKLRGSIAHIVNSSPAPSPHSPSSLTIAAITIINSAVGTKQSTRK